MRKIVFIYERFITIRDYHRFGMDYLESKGYEVELWRVRGELRPNVRVTDLSIGMYQGKNVHDLSWSEFGKRTKKNRRALFILFEYYSVIYIGTMARYKCDYFLIRGTGKILFSGSNTNRVKDIKKRRLKVNSTERFQKIFVQVAEYFFRRHLPQYAFLGVDVNERWTNYIPCAKKIYIHSWDYDRYLENRKDENEEGEWIVYIDSGFGNTDINDLVVGSYNPWEGKGEKIWNKLGAVFDILEERYHMPVVVAGHPHTKYAGDTLCGRKIIFNNTPELIAKSRFVIMQWSTTISLVLLFKKKILVLIDNDFKKVSNWKNYYNTNYKYFGITPCNMDIQEMAQTPWKYIHEVDSEIAQKYIDTFVKMPGTPDKLFVETVEEKINEITKQRSDIHKRRGRGIREKKKLRL